MLGTSAAGPPTPARPQGEGRRSPPGATATSASTTGFSSQLTLSLADNFLGQVRLAQGDNDAAAHLFTDALAVARRIQDWLSLLISLYDLALATHAGDETSAAYYLEVLAAVAGQQDNPQRAVRLFAAARSIRDTRGSGWLHAFVPRVPPGDAVLAALRSQMGDAAFEQTEAWGRSAGSKRAVEYALRQEGPAAPAPKRNKPPARKRNQPAT